MVKLAVFDLDGTLLNTLEDLAGACNHALREGCFPIHEPNAYKEFVGRGPVHLIKSALPEANRDEATVQKMREKFSAYYIKHSQDFTRPYNGVTEAIKAIRETGAHVAVFSNKPHDHVVELCDIYFHGLIDMAIGFRDGVEPKPDPGPGLDIMRKFSALPEETVFIGDSEVDMETGKNMGAYTVGVSWGFRPKKALQNAGADVIIDKADDLVTICIDK